MVCQMYDLFVSVPNVYQNLGNSLIKREKYCQELFRKVSLFNLPTENFTVSSGKWQYIAFLITFIYFVTRIEVS